MISRLFDIKTIIIFSIYLIVIPLENNAQEDSLQLKQLELIESCVSNYPTGTQLSIAIVQNDTVYYWGVKKIKSNITQVDNRDSLFEIGSITKVFTSTLLASLIVDQTLSLNSDVSDHISNQLDPAPTLQELANHTSGLPRLPDNLDLAKVDLNNPYKSYDETLLKEYIINEQKLEKKGKNAYSNLGAGLLGYILTEVTEKSYTELLASRIFDKYKMTSSCLYDEVEMERLVLGLDPDGDTVSNWEFDALVGAGGIISSVSDLAQFAKAQLDPNNLELSLTQKPTFKIGENMDIGLGWHILDIGLESRVLWHNGGTGGYTSSMTVDTENNQAVIILSNISSFHKESAYIDNLGFSLIQGLAKE